MEELSTFKLELCPISSLSKLKSMKGGMLNLSMHTHNIDDGIMVLPMS